MKNSVFREWVPAGFLIKFLMVSFSLIVVVISLLLLLDGNLTSEDSFGFIIGWGVLAFVLFLFWNYRGLEILVNNDRFSVKYGLFNKKSMEFSQISSCRVTKASFGRYAGIGVRYGLDGSIAYTTSFGSAVEITPKEGQLFVFSSNNPEKICKIIRTQKK